MLTVSCISKSFGMQPILKNISFVVNSNDRLGLIGANGCGKSTLLRIIMGLDEPDGGKVSFLPETLRVGYLSQDFKWFNEQTVGQYLDTLGGNPEELNTRLETLARRLSQNPEDQLLQTQYDEVLSLIIAAGANSSRADAVLPALGLTGIPRSQMASTLSGGQKTRLALAGVLISAPQLLILDEPTNHLDITMLTWLEEWLLKQHGAVLFVSHDRLFLDRISNGILELDSQTHTLKSYPGNYRDYFTGKQMELDHHWQQYTDQQEEIKRLKRAAERVRSRAQHTSGGKLDDNDKLGKGFFNNRALEIMRRSKGIEKRVEHMLTDEKIDKPRSNWQMKIGFENVQPTGRDVLVMEDLSIGFEGKAILCHLNTSIRYGSRVALVGENGSGKTTLLRTLMGLISPLVGRYHFGSQVKPGYMPQEGQEASFEKDAFSTIAHLTPYSETEVRRFLSYYLFTGDEVFIPVGHLSFGEKARLSLASLVASGCNFLLLDEPTNHLDIASRVRFEQALEAFAGTTLIISHDRYFIEQFATEVWEIKDRSIRVNL